MLAVGTPKTRHSQRILPVPAFLMEMLRERCGSAASEYVFGRRGHVAEPRTLQRRFQRLAKRLGIQGVHFHTLRHPYVKHTTKNIILKSRKPKLSDNRPDNLGFLLL